MGEKLTSHKFWIRPVLPPKRGGGGGGGEDPHAKRGSFQQLQLVVIGKVQVYCTTMDRGETSDEYCRCTCKRVFGTAIIVVSYPDPMT